MVNLKVKVSDLLETRKYNFSEIEKWIEETDLQNTSSKELLQMFVEEFDITDIIYLIDAYRMPKNEIEEALDIYDNSKIPLDEISFVNHLATKYSVDIATIIRRIQEVRYIKKVEKKSILEEKKVKKTQK